jgi:predicted amidohydrolase YtcJ
MNRTARGLSGPTLLPLTLKTYDLQCPKAEAFAVRGGRFIAVGTSADVKDLIGASTEIFDAKGMTIVPGFIDCHNHAAGETLLYMALVGAYILAGEIATPLNRKLPG